MTENRRALIILAVAFILYLSLSSIPNFNLSNVKKLFLISNTSIQSSTNTDLHIPDSNNFAFIDSSKEYYTKSDTIRDTSARVIDGKWSVKSGLSRFFSALHRLRADKSKKVRIAYFGDSMIEGDLITQHLRDSLQSLFGGNGIGWIPLYAQAADLRMSVSVSNVGNKLFGSLGQNDSAQYPFGISGEFLVSYDSLNPYGCKVKANNYFKHASVFPTVELLHKPTISNASSISVSVDGITNAVQLKSVKGKVNSTRIIESPSKTFDIKFDRASSEVLYGFDVSSEDGLILDNFASRGNSGLTFTGIKCSDLQQFQSILKYDLLILHFGMNVVSDKSSFEWYKKGMITVVRHLQACVPNADILIISLPDKGKMDRGEIVSHPGVLKIRKAQQEVAEIMNVGWFDFFEAMGGEGSMAEWAEAKPPLARKDYAHFNSAGSEKAAGLIIEYLLNGLDSQTEKNLNEMTMDNAGN